MLTTSTLVVFTSACSLLNKEQPPPPPVINDYVSAVQVLGDGGNSEIVNQQLGDGVADGPVAKVPEDTTVVNGGSVQEAITSTAPFSKVRVGLEPLTSAASPGTSPAPTSAAPVTPKGPARGYHEITLTKPNTEIEIVLTITQSLPGDKFIFYFAVVDAGGKQGKLSQQKVDAIQVGTGEVQVSVQWDGDSDVDLHVVDPNGDEVFWDNTSIASGGELDLDSNANCDLDHVRNENITWSKAPPGKYTVRLDYFLACDIDKTNYVVTVRVNGQPTRTFSGSFSGEGDEGGEGDGKQITTFEVVAPAPSKTA